MNCLPAVGGPIFGLLFVAVLGVAVGVVLLRSRHAARSLGAVVAVAALLGAGLITPSAPAHADQDDCPPTSQSGDAGQDGPAANDEAMPDSSPGTEGPEEATVVFAVEYTATAGGFVEGETSQSVEEGEDASPVTAVAEPSHSFDGWSDGRAEAERHDRDIRAAVEVEATFVVNTYALRYAATDGGSIDGPSEQSVIHGEDASAVTAVPDTGYSFVGWSDGSTTNPRIDESVIGDLEVTAEFVRNVYTLSYVAGPHGSVQGELQQSVAHGANATPVTAVPDAGHSFVRWSDGSTDNPRTDTAVTADASLTAVFEIDVYALTYSAGPGGTIDGQPVQTIEHGSNGTEVTAVPDTGYVFAGWSDGSTDNPRTDTNITSDSTVTAEFELLTYELQYTAAPGGTIGGTTTQTIGHGSNGTEVTAVPDTGYAFTGWSDGNTDNPRTDTDVTTDLSVTAQFTRISYTVTYDAGPNGSIDGETDQTIEHGDDATPVTAVPDTGYTFTGWSDGNTDNPRTDTTVTADLSVTAQFTRISYTVTYDAGPNGSIDGETDQTIEHGDDGTPVTAIPNTGYAFTGWSDGNTDNPRTDTDVTTDLTVTAEFTDVLDLPLHGFLRSQLAGSTPQVLSIANTGADLAEYLLVPTRTSAGSASLALQISGNAVPSGGTTTITAPILDPRRTDRLAAVTLFEESRDRVSGDAGTASGQVPHGVVPSVGDTWQLNRDMTATCDSTDVATATVRAVRSQVIIVSDEENPTGGFDTAAYNSIADQLQTEVYGPVTSALGDPSDVDGNGRIVVFITRGVNTHVTESSPGSLVVSRPRDLLSHDACAASNLGEVFYATAPDPNGTLGFGVRTTSLVRGAIPRDVAHELGYHIADAARFAADAPLDTSWLSEALADSAIDRAFYAASGSLSPLANIVLANLTTGSNASQKVSAFNTYVNANFIRYRNWLAAPHLTGVLSGENTLAARGGAWAFLRYSADRYAGTSLEREEEFFAQLAASHLSGSAALAQVSGGDPEAWVDDFLIAVFTDDQPDAGPLGTSGPWSTASWNFRSVFSGLGGYPLSGMGLTVDADLTIELAGDGAARHVLFSVPAGQTATVELTSPSGAEIGFTLLRIK